jgi:NADH:ubiquinone oxidoreductase subunit 4 (subunit M)
MVLVAAFTLRALKKTFFGEGAIATGGSAAPPDDANKFSASPTLLASSAERSIHQSLIPISAAEKWGAGLLMFATVAAGLYPKFLLDRILPAVDAMHFLKP